MAAQGWRGSGKARDLCLAHAQFILHASVRAVPPKPSVWARPTECVRACVRMIVGQNPTALRNQKPQKEPKSYERVDPKK